MQQRLPQKNLMEYCEQNSVFCLDLLPSFKQYPKEDIFVLNNSRPGHYDIWHLTKFGHEVAAREILRVLQEQKLMRGDKNEN